MTSPPDPRPDSAARLHSIVRALRKQRGRLARKVEAIRGDLAEAERAPEHRRNAEALLAYLHQVPKRAAHVKLADPHDPDRTLEIALDPALNAQGNAARYFKRAAKGERGAPEIRARLAAAEAELAALADLLERTKALDSRGLQLSPGRVATHPRPVRRASKHDEHTPGHVELAPGPVDVGPEHAQHAPGHVEVTKPEHLPLRGLERDLEAAARHLPPALRAELVAAAPPVAPQRDEAGEVIHRPAPPRAKRPEVPARLQPRRLRTSEGWDVLIGRSNEGNDHLTLHLARPEDYWFHVHGAAGSHVVLRRGKGKNEPSKRTLEEVAAWTAFYSQARTAGRVPVIWTLKKYVRKPRGAKPGTVICEREKSLMVRPGEPPKTALAGDEPTPDDHA